MSARIPPNSGHNRDCFGPGLSLDRLEAGRGGRIHFDSQLPGNWSHRYTSWSPDYRLVRSFIRSPLGPSVLLSLSVASFLTGGGVAQIVLFTLAWAGATQAALLVIVQVTTSPLANVPLLKVMLFVPAGLLLTIHW